MDHLLLEGSREGEEAQDTGRGVSDLWSQVNHVALIVSDVGRSLGFYANVLGMKQVMRPNFDRHGAWLTFGNIDLHLIKGRPVVHEDDDLIVSHIAVTVSASRMEELRSQLKAMGIPSRKNISVPNPSLDAGVMDQAFVRDPDGHYIEFCSCESLENYLKEKMKLASQGWDVFKTKSAMSASQKLKGFVARQQIEEHGIVQGIEELSPEELNVFQGGKDDDVEEGSAQGPDDQPVDQEKLQNLVKRRKVYGDITQNATEGQLAKLMALHRNHIPEVVKSLEKWVKVKGSHTHIPPGFYDRDGSFVQPPGFEMASSPIREIVKKSGHRRP